MTVSPVAFYVLATLVLGGAVAVVTLRNLVHAALALMATLFAVGCLYFAIDADFLAGAQIAIYVAAIPILLIFGIMLTRGSMGPDGNRLARTWPAAALVAALACAGLVTVFVASRDDWRVAGWPQQLVDEGTTATLGRTLLTQQALPFEVASVLLLVALVGAVTLARRDEREIAMERAARERREREERARRRREDRERARSRTAAAEAEAGP